MPPPNARFWVFKHTGPVKLTLRPGQTLHHYHGERTEEGWTSTAESWFYPRHGGPVESGPRFNDFREITAKFGSTGTCGHPIDKGDRIGFAPRKRRGAPVSTCCATCWARWVSEVAEADLAERMGGY